ncbi:hypothetical protein [Lentisalinibacter orientalis]|uniref:hypothetical protein n=1 Tax=Lentisalinibacter orientalis TaxID=2992241 RepID=UPI003868E53E
MSRPVLPIALWLPATAAWVAAGVLSMALLAAGPGTAPVWAWIAAALPVGLTLPFMLLRRPDSFLLALLGSAGYAGFGLMESIANPPARLLAATVAAVSLLAFFLLVPVVRITRSGS